MNKNSLQTKPDERYWTGASFVELSKVFNLPFNSQMQDWPYEVADSKCTQEYLDYYQAIDNEDIKFTLMEMIVQSIEDQQSPEKFKTYWDQTVPLLTKNFHIHEWTIYYWSSFEKSLKNAWHIAPYMRKIWHKRNTLNQE